MKSLIIVGEDDVTRAILIRILAETGLPYSILREEPVRGGQVESVELIAKYNRLALSYPVILLTDLDNEDCPIAILNRHFKETSPKNEAFVFRIAVSEAEVWLMADRQGFSNFLGIDESFIPGLKGLNPRNPLNVELEFPFKPSLYLMKTILPSSVRADLKRQLTPIKGARKGPEYNSALLPFIEKQ